jgi:hypothetical protein
MADVKPRTASGYNLDVTQACEQTLLTLLSAFGNLKDSLRLVGGLVPRYLTPQAHPEVPAHAGTSDVDVVLNLEVLASGDEYASLADQLKARGFERALNKQGIASSWRWRRSVGDHLQVVVELLRDAGEHQPGRAVSISGEEVSAMCIKHAGITAEWFCERPVTARLLEGQGVSTEQIRFADVPAFVILKALAMDQRQEPKDAADLIHVVRYAGSLDEVAELYAARIRSGQYEDAMRDGLRVLKLRFCDDEHAHGYEKVGPVAYAQFVGAGDDDERMRLQLGASHLVERLLQLIHEKTTFPEPTAHAQLATLGCTGRRRGRVSKIPTNLPGPASVVCTTYFSRSAPTLFQKVT